MLNHEVTGLKASLCFFGIFLPFANEQRGSPSSPTGGPPIYSVDWIKKLHARTRVAVRLIAWRQFSCFAGQRRLACSAATSETRCLTMRPRCPAYVSGYPISFHDGSRVTWEWRDVLVSCATNNMPTGKCKRCWTALGGRSSSDGMLCTVNCLFRLHTWIFRILGYFVGLSKRLQSSWLLAQRLAVMSQYACVCSTQAANSRQAVDWW